MDQMAEDVVGAFPQVPQNINIPTSQKDLKHLRINMAKSILQCSVKKTIARVVARNIQKDRTKRQNGLNAQNAEDGTIHVVWQCPMQSGMRNILQHHQNGNVDSVDFNKVKSDPDMDNQPRIGFIGAGNMAYGIAKGILSGDVLPVNVKVSAPSTRNFGRFEELGITVTHSNSEVVSGSDLVFLAVKPHLVPGVLSEISPLVTQKHIIVSVAAGITLATLELLLPAETVTLRLMPNLPCVLQEGALLFSRGPCAKPEHAALLSSLLQQCGLVEEGPEAWIDIHTGLSGSGVAFVYLFAEALAEGAVKMGMPSSLAHSIASQTIVGAGRLLRDSGKHPAQLRSDVCTPGGTTIYGLHALERGGLRAAAMGAVEAATQRATELGQKTAAAGSRK